MIEFIQSQALKLLGGLAGALAITLAVVMWRADSISEARDAAVQARVTEEAKHEVTRASLASLSDRMAKLVEEGELRKERLSEALVEVDKETAPLREQADKLERGEITVFDVEGL